MHLEEWSLLAAETVFMFPGIPILGSRPGADRPMFASIVAGDGVLLVTSSQTQLLKTHCTPNRSLFKFTMSMSVITEQEVPKISCVLNLVTVLTQCRACQYILQYRAGATRLSSSTSCLLLRLTYPTTKFRVFDHLLAHQKTTQKLILGTT